MEKENIEILKDIEEYLKKGLIRPAETIIVTKLIEKMIQIEHIKRPVYSSDDFYYCPNCNRWMYDSDLITSSTVVTIDQIDPPENYCICPKCDHKTHEDNIEVHDTSDIIELLNNHNIGVK